MKVAPLKKKNSTENRGSTQKKKDTSQKKKDSEKILQENLPERKVEGEKNLINKRYGNKRG